MVKISFLSCVLLGVILSGCGGEGAEDRYKKAAAITSLPESAGPVRAHMQETQKGMELRIDWKEPEKTSAKWKGHQIYALCSVNQTASPADKANKEDEAPFRSVTLLAFKDKKWQDNFRKYGGKCTVLVLETQDRPMKLLFAKHS